MPRMMRVLLWLPAVSAGVGEHGDEGDQQGHGGKGGLIFAQNAAGDHARDHQHQQPHDAVLGQGVKALVLR